MDEQDRKKAEEEILTEGGDTPSERRKQKVFYIKWALFFGILIVLMAVCLIFIYLL